MSKRYIFLAFILIAAAFGLTQLPEKDPKNPIGPRDLLVKVNDLSRFVDTHFIARRLIERDPSLLLIDIRTADEYEAYNIPGSVNIPVEEVLTDQWQPYVNQTAMDVVFYGTGDVFAEQAWVLCTQKGYPNLYVMKGGLNEWFGTIIQPQPPTESAPSEAFEQYDFERAASIYFGGTTVQTAAAPLPKKSVELKKKVKKAAEGGC